MLGRTRHATAILGSELSARLPKTKVLLVGAGGIGCELRELITILPLFLFERIHSLPGRIMHRELEMC